MNCPGCGSPLREEVEDGLAVATCARCNGLWLRPPSSDAAAGDRTLSAEAVDALARFAARARELLDRNAEFESIMDHIPVEVVLKDEEGRYVYVNRHTEELYGRGREEVRGKLPHDLFDARAADELRAHDLRVLSSGASHTVEVEDPMGRTFLATSFPVRDSQERVTGLAGIAINISSRKKAERELSKLNVELEARVEERTASLKAAQQELVLKERLATLGQIAATVSHELRNPLSAIRTSLYVVSKRVGAGDARLDRALERMSLDLSRCDRIIDEMLGYAGAGRAVTEATPVDEWIEELLTERDLPDGVELRTHLGAPGVVLPVDRDRLRRALSNVIDNACHAMQERGEKGPSPALDVSTRTVGDRFEVAVTDTGVGIEPDVLPRIFEPLFSTKGFGTGLGLSAVKDVLESHGGGVSVDSAPGTGTRVVLWIPRRFDA